MVLVELERTPHRVELGGFQRLAHGFLVLDLALDIAHGGIHQHGGVVGLGGIQRGQAAKFLLEVGDELLVGRVVHVVRPLRRVEHAQHGLAHGLDDVLVRRETGAEQHSLLGQTGRHILLDEVDAQAARQEDEHRVGFGRADLGQLGAVVQLVQRGVGLHGHFTLEVTLEAGQGVLARGVVGGDQGDLLEALVLHDLANGLVHVVVLVRRAEEVGVALRTGVLRRAGVGADVEGLVLERGGAHGQHQVGEHQAGHEIDLVALDQALGGLLGHVGALLVVGHDHFGRQATELAAGVLDRQLETVTDVHAQAGTGARQGAEQADLHVVGSVGGGSQQGCGHGAGEQQGLRQARFQHRLHGRPFR